MRKPQSFIPILVCEDITAVHDFSVTAFAFTSSGIHRLSDGQAAHAELRVGDLLVWLHRVSEDLNLRPPRSLSAASSGLIVYVEDVDAHFARAKSHGAHIQTEPEDMPYGQREYSVRDIEGHQWWFAAPVK